ncbi:MAG: DUF5675 family protein [Flavobacterium sp.]|nr:DUF5675 family protein [Flavobacterium sp.]
MNKATLTRNSDSDKETLGSLTVISDNGQRYNCKTLELLWKNNASQVSCIPTGTYTCKFTRSNRLSTEAKKDVFTYEVQNVKDRAGIRIHSANYFFQLLGCIALGNTVLDINGDHIPDVTNSKATIKAFEQFMGGEDFLLEVK